MGEQLSLLPKPRWNPRYLAYCAAHGHAGDPEGMMAADVAQWPGGRMVGFMLWMSAKWREYNRANAIPVRAPRTHVMQDDFDAWLGELFENFEQLESHNA